MPVLKALYEYMGRGIEWARLVREIVPDFCDPQSDGPLAGREAGWAIVIQYRAQLAAEARHWSEAERLQRIKVEWVRQHAAFALSAPREPSGSDQREAIFLLATSLAALARFLSNQGKSECVPLFEETIGLYQRINDRSAEAATALNLGNVYSTIPSLRNWSEAERLYRQSLDLRPSADHLGRSKCYSQLGYMHWARLVEEQEAGKPEEEVRPYLNEAEACYTSALDELKPLSTIEAVQELAVISSMLGNLYREKGQADSAVQRYREAIRWFTQEGDLFQAAAARFNTALALGNAGRFQEALLYAEAAQQNFAETVGDDASETQKTQQIIEMIKQQLDQKGSEQHDDIQGV